MELDTGPADDQKAENYVRNTYPPKKSDPFAAFDQIVKEEKSWKGNTFVLCDNYVRNSSQRDISFEICNLLNDFFRHNWRS